MQIEHLIEVADAIIFFVPMVFAGGVLIVAERLLSRRRTAA